MRGAVRKEGFKYVVREALSSTCISCINYHCVPGSLPFVILNLPNNHILQHILNLGRTAFLYGNVFRKLVKVPLITSLKPHHLIVILRSLDSFSVSMCTHSSILDQEHWVTEYNGKDLKRQPWDLGSSLGNTTLTMILLSNNIPMLVFRTQQMVDK